MDEHASIYRCAIDGNVQSSTVEQTIDPARTTRKGSVSSYIAPSSVVSRRIGSRPFKLKKKQKI